MNQADIDRQTVAEACQGMEPQRSIGMSVAVAEGVKTTALISIAVSLKRIADNLEKK